MLEQSTTSSLYISLPVHSDVRYGTRAYCDDESLQYVQRGDAPHSLAVAPHAIPLPLHHSIAATKRASAFY